MNPYTAAALAYAAQMGQELDESQLEALEQYELATPPYAGSFISSDPSVSLWLIVEIPKEKFSEKIEYNEELDLLLAPAGKFIGFALSGLDVDKMTTSKLKEVELRGEPEEGLRKEVVAESVYLTYKAEVRGHKELLKLLEFLLAEKMLKPQGN